MPNQTTSGDSESTSVADTLKNLFKRNKKNIIGGSAALVVAAGVFISLAKEQDLTEGTEDFVPFPDPVSKDQKRQSPSLHTVREHQRRTKDGTITIPPYVRGGSTA
ncbi:hypothetical protein OG749_17875 [Streptomyces nojiriensis]|uniref:hypothetical protein n=1 Tax=Streptomyces nojiriensis TaxID=66374 RepID=UPI002E177C99